MFRLLQSGVGLIATLLAAQELLGQQASADALLEELARLRDSGKEIEIAQLESQRRLLRDWINAHLPGNLADLERSSGGLQNRLNDQLRSQWNAPPARVYIPDGFPSGLVVEANIAVPCGVDTSVYVYRFNADGRVRLLEGSGGHKNGNYLRDIRFSTPDASGNRMLYVSWFAVSCASVWNMLDYRLFSVGERSNRAAPVFSGTHSFTIDGDVHVKLTTKEFLLEFTAEALEPGWRRTYVLHYKIDDSVVTRVDPVALQPQDFVHEWIREPWPEMASRSTSGLETWHKRLHAKGMRFVDYDFAQPCSERKGFTQIAVEVGEIYKSKPVYFLVQDLGDHRFRMSTVSDVRQSGCPGESRPIDFTIQPSLFTKE